MLRILLLGYGDIPSTLSEGLKAKGEEIIYFTELVTLEQILKWDIDFVISYNYHHIIGEKIIEAYPKKIVNLHISYLPYNRGAHPNFWSFWDDTPKGVTIHYVDEGLDTGDIIIQKEMFFDKERETLQTTYDKLHMEIQRLLLENWELIKTQQLTGVEQKGAGTFHYARELDEKWYNLEARGGGGWRMSIKELEQISKRSHCGRLRKRIWKK